MSFPVTATWVDLSCRAVEPVRPVYRSRDGALTAGRPGTVECPLGWVKRMRDAPTLHLAEIAAMPGPLHERAQALLHELVRHVPFDASWIALAEPLGAGYTSLASTSLDQRTVQYLSGPKMAHDIEVTGANRANPPLSPSDLPYPADKLPTWAECLIRAGYHEALAVGLFAPGSRHVGFLALLSARTQPPTQTMRRRLRRLSPILARGIDPMRSLLTAARLVRGVWAG